MNNEIRSVLKTVKYYSDGVFECDQKKLKKAFSKNAVLNGVIGERYVAMSAADFIEGMMQGPSMKDAETDFRSEILSADVSGILASVVLREYNFYGKQDYIDFFQLIKVGKVWKIVSKAFRPAP